MRVFLSYCDISPFNCVSVLILCLFVAIYGFQGIIFFLFLMLPSHFLPPFGGFYDALASPVALAGYSVCQVLADWIYELAPLICAGLQPSHLPGGCSSGSAGHRMARC